jgi:voltage-gated potassium channel
LGTVSLKVEQLDRRALGLMLSIVLYLVVGAALENHPLQSLVLIVLLYAVLLAAILQFAALKGGKVWLLFGVPLAGLSMVFMMLSHVMPTRPLIVAREIFLILFFTLVISGFFHALGRPGAVTKGRLYTSVSVYLILAMMWTLVYVLIETLHPGSFLMPGKPSGSHVPRSLMLYMSLVCLTTLGTADLVPVSQLTRMLMGMESVTGVMYVAVTIARLVSAYQASRDQQS